MIMNEKDRAALDLLRSLVEQTNATAGQHRALAAALAHLAERLTPPPPAGK